MTPKALIILAALFVVAFALLGLGHCGYNKIDSMLTLENKAASIREEFSDVEHIETDTLALLLQAKETAPVLLVDSRSPEEYEVSHIPGAVNLETVEAVQSHLSGMENPPENVIVYCSVGHRSAILAEQLKEAGFNHTRNVVGSMFAWANEDREMVDAGGNAAEKVHPYNEFWGRMLKPERRADLAESE